jgi:transposase
MTKRRAYTSDIKDEQWKVISEYLPKSSGMGPPERYPKREILNGIFYVLKTGCSWRDMPNDLPPWDTVYGYFRRWTKAGVWDWMADRLREDARRHNKKKPRRPRGSSTAKP